MTCKCWCHTATDKEREGMGECLCDEPNPVHEAEREEWRSAEQSLSEMERAHYDTDTH